MSEIEPPAPIIRLVTVPAAAAAIRRGLRDGWSTADLLRVVREMRSNSRHLRTDADRVAFVAEQPTTGDPRWDAMLAGNAEQLSEELCVDVPGWTGGHVLDEPWFVGTLLGMRDYARENSPPWLKRRKSFLDPDDLESV